MKRVYDHQRAEIQLCLHYELLMFLLKVSRLLLYVVQINKNIRTQLFCVFQMHETIYRKKQVTERVYESLFTQLAPDKVQTEEEVVKTLYCTIQQRLSCGFQDKHNIYKRITKCSYGI